MFDRTTVFCIQGYTLVIDYRIGKKENFMSEYEKIKPKAEQALADILAAYGE